MKVSLIISTYEWPEALALCLRSVARQSRLPDEVLIADDGSSVKTAYLIRGWQASLPIPIHHMWQPKEGFRLARSRNRAIAMARGEYVILVDGDMILHKHFIADHICAATAQVFIQGVRLLTKPRAAERMLGEGRLDLGFFAAGVERRHHTIRSRVLSRLVQHDRTDQRFVRGCNQAYWRSDLIRVNGFNEEIVGWGREDNEIAARLYHVGVVRRMLKFQALAIHLHHPRRHPQGVNPNDAILEDTIAQRRTWCTFGLDQHLA